MEQLIAALTGALQNQFLSGGAALMVMGALMALCRRLPFTVWNYLRRNLTVTVEMLNSDPVFEWMSAWLDLHPYSKRAKRLTASTKGDEGGARSIIFTPAPGNHFFMYRRRLVWFHRERSAGGGGAADKEEQMFASRARETFTLRIIGRDQTVARQLMEEARDAYMAAARKQPELFISNLWYWSNAGFITPRAIESVVLPAGVSERLVADVEEFLSSRAWYAARGIPFRRGYLMEGVPGSGKSSLIRALASVLKLNLYMLNLGSAGMSDEKLSSLMSEVKDNSIILLEDVDAAARRPLQDTAAANTGGAVATPGITFSGLLNALDGVNAREGVMVWMTTNHKERLDEALIRPGRVDVEQHFGYASREQAARLFSHFYPDHTAGLETEFAANIPRGAAMAALQQHLLNFKTDPAAAASSAARANFRAAA